MINIIIIIICLIVMVGAIIYDVSYKGKHKRRIDFLCNIILVVAAVILGINVGALL